MEVDSVFVTGANRGIGLEFVKQFARLQKPPRLIFATYRNLDSAKDLTQIRNETKNSQIILIKMDVTLASEIESARKTVEDMVGDKGLTLLINNAGVGKPLGFPDITNENMLFHFYANTLGPLKVLKEVFPLLKRASAAFPKSSGMSVSRAAVINISAEVGSMTGLTPQMHALVPDILGYRTSKAALNMMMRVAALQTIDENVLIVQMCPGWVKTDMGGSYAELELNESVSTMMSTLPALDQSYHGGFFNRKGHPIPY